MVREIKDNNALTIPATSVSRLANSNGELEKSPVSPPPAYCIPTINVSDSGVVNVVGNIIENTYIVKKTAITLEDKRNKLTAADKLKTAFGDRKKRLYVAIIATICVLIPVIVLSVVLSQHRSSSANSTDSDDDALLPSNFSGRYISREYWFAATARGNLSSFPTMPLTRVLVDNPRGYQCLGHKYCPGMLKYIQNSHFLQGMIDIGYSFVIADDGYIYEGRGWDYVGNFSSNYNECSYGIAFLGNYGLIEMPQKQITAFNLLMKEAVKLGKLNESYELCPTPAMVSYKSKPVYFLEEIKNWDQYTSECSPV